MNQKERQIYEAALLVDTALKSFTPFDVLIELEKGQMQSQTTATIDVTDSEIESAEFQDVLFYYSGEITYDADTHQEKDFIDDSGWISVDIIDRVYDNIIGLDGVLRAEFGDEKREIKIDY